MPLFDAISSEVKIVLQRQEESLMVGLRLFAVLFWVDLENAGHLRGFVAGQKEVPDLAFIAPDERLPREGPRQGKTRYRITIHREG